MKTAVTETSLRAYRGMSTADLTAKQRQVVDAMRPGNLYTRRELETLANMRTGSVCGRVNELIELGRIDVCGEKFCRESGRQVEALRLASEQMELC